MKDIFKGKTKAVAALLVVLAAGYVLGSGSVPSVLMTESSAEPACRTFCEAIPDAEYGFVREVNDMPSCFCLQEQEAYDFDAETTLRWTQAVNVGIIRDASVEQGIPPEVVAERQRELAELQQLLEQQAEQQTG